MTFMLSLLDRGIHYRSGTIGLVVGGQLAVMRQGNWRVNPLLYLSKNLIQNFG